MAPAEQALAVAQRHGGLVGPPRAVLRGWGGGEGVPAELMRPRSVQQLQAALELARARLGRRNGLPGAIVRGLGRSYGDAAQLCNGLVLDITRLKGIELDRERGSVKAGAGVTLAELLDRLVPDGWLVPV